MGMLPGIASRVALATLKTVFVKLITEEMMIRLVVLGLRRLESSTTNNLTREVAALAIAQLCDGKHIPERDGE